MPKLRRIELVALPFSLGAVVFSLVTDLLAGGKSLAIPSGGNMPLGALVVSISLGLALLWALSCTRSSVGAGTAQNGFWAAPLFAALLFCGALCSARASLCSLSGSVRPLAGGPLGEALRGLGENFNALLESLPLKSSEDNALLKALLLGDRSALSPETVSAFRQSGASHILALSGLHLGVIYGVISRTGKLLLGNSIAAEKLRSVLIILTTGAYTVMTGAGASLCRAFLFILVRETGVLLGRKSDLRTTLAGSFILQVCIDAGALREAGFQLSYLAIAGIAYICPSLSGLYPQGKAQDSSDEATSKERDRGKLRSKLKGLIPNGIHLPRPMRFIWDSAALSISCQLTTGPLAWYYFGTFPQYFLLTNLIAIPLTGLLIPAALLCAALSAPGLCPKILPEAVSLLSKTLRASLEVIATL